MTGRIIASERCSQPDPQNWLRGKRDFADGITLRMLGQGGYPLFSWWVTVREGDLMMEVEIRMLQLLDKGQ